MQKANLSANAQKRATRRAEKANGSQKTLREIIKRIQ